MAIKHMKRCYTSPVIREIQIKTMMRYRYTLSKMAKMKRLTSLSVDKDVEQCNSQTLRMVMENGTGTATLENIT